MRTDLPGGTVTFLFTDIEGSTRLLDELGVDIYASALAEHRRIVRESCAAARQRTIARGGKPHKESPTGGMQPSVRSAKIAFPKPMRRAE